MRHRKQNKIYTTYRPFHKRSQRQANEAIEYFPYFRKSSEENTEKQILSLERQRNWGERTADANGHTLKPPFEEEKSAKHPYQRPAFDRMVDQIRKGEARGIYTWKLDRLARNPEEAGIVMGMLSRGEILHIVTSQREYRPEDNALISYVDFGIADQYSRDLSTNVYDGLHNKAALGDYPGHACLGYLNTKYREKGKNKIIVDPDRFEKVRQVLHRLLSGNYTVSEVILFAEKELHLTAPATGKRPERPMSRSGWYRFFANPLPSGWYEYPKESGNWIKGNHEPMITLGEFERIQALLGNSGKPRGTKRQHTYRGLIQCGSCPAVVTAENKIKRQKNGKVHFYTYYHCTKRVKRDCPERSIEIKELEDQIATALSKIAISNECNRWANFALALTNTKDEQDIHLIQKNNAKELSKVDSQLEALKLKYTSLENVTGELFSDQEYLELKRRFQRKKDIIQRSIIRPDEEVVEEANELTKETFQLAHFARSHFLKGDDESKRDIVARVGSNRTLKDKKLLITLTEPLLAISEKRKLVESEISQVRTANYVENNGCNADLVALCPMLRGLVDEIRTYWMTNNDHFNDPKIPPSSAGEL